MSDRDGSDQEEAGSGGGFEDRRRFLKYALALPFAAPVMVSFFLSGGSGGHGLLHLLPNQLLPNQLPPPLPPLPLPQITLPHHP